MTHDTDAERQAFEAWLGIKPCGAAHDLAWSAWKAARRAPAAPVPHGMKLVPVVPTSEMLGAADREHAARGLVSIALISYQAMLAAAPQPPEAAPTNVWQQAVDNALVSAHLGVAGEVTAEEAEKMLNDLICWNIEVATDPLTNGGKVLVSADALAANNLPEAAQSNSAEFDGIKTKLAPVQLPDPAGVVVTSIGNYASVNAATFVRKGDKLYTEQQVRELLASAKVERKPISDSVLDTEYLRDQKIKGEVQSFRAGARFAETFHGIGKDKA